MSENNFIEIISAFAQIGIAASVAYVAYQNYRINGATFKIQKDKFRLDLFDRRHNVFKSIQDLLLDILKNGIPSRKSLGEFNIQTSDAEFLFGEDIKKYIEDLGNKSLRSIHVNERLSNSDIIIDNNKRKELATELYNLEEWFSKQFIDSRKLFKRYLHFSIIKNP